ncbi:MAG TPA: hypothetical protein VFT61_07420 [Sphingomicrobium sp.]|nr:hypothetical protein [Sphingomicrobium sp.]
MKLNIRWTIGDVADEGFEALRLSLWGADRLFPPDAGFHVCVNTISVDEAKHRTGDVPERVQWRSISREVPHVLEPFLDGTMSEGTAWKFIPLLLDRGVRELAIDNDLILWELPLAIRRWMEDPEGTLVAADVTPAHGQFAEQCGPEPRNSGIRGTPANFDYEAAIRSVLADNPVKLRSELDEQGLQIAALSRCGVPYVVPVEDVSICSPFPPHSPELGRCGAHLVGLNTRNLPWDFQGRPAREVRLEHWRRHRPELYRLVDLNIPAELEPAE